MSTFWPGRRVLVTGANGFLASWVVKSLVAAGAQVVALIFAKNPLSLFEQERLDERTETVYGDVMNFGLLQEIIRKYRIQTVFHLGAQAICLAAEEDPLSTFDINIKGTYHVLEAVRRISPATQVIVASSDKAYGIHKLLPYEEHFPLHGEYPYEVSKTCADLISTAYWHTYRLPVCIVRCGNLYGGGDAHFSRLIPRTIKRVYEDKAPELFANDIRDYLYVEDAVAGYLLLAQKMEEGILGEAFNFGTEQPRSVQQVIELICTMMGKPHLQPVPAAQSRKGIPEQYLSYQKAKRMLGWEPLVPFEEGLNRTIQWYTDYFRRAALLPLPAFTIYHRDLL